MLVALRSISGHEFAVDCANVSWDRFGGFLICEDVFCFIDEDGPIWVYGEYVEFEFDIRFYSFCF